MKPNPKKPKKVVADSERARFVSAVKAGLADAIGGRVHSAAEVIRRMEARFGGKKV